MGIDIAAERAKKEQQQQKEAEKRAEAERQRQNQQKMAELRQADKKKREVPCQQCGTPMKKGKKVRSSTSGQLMGCAVFLIGLFLAFLFPIGTIIGLFLMLGAAGMGVSRKKGMKCPNCKYFFETS